MVEIQGRTGWRLAAGFLPSIDRALGAHHRGNGRSKHRGQV